MYNLINNNLMEFFYSEFWRDAQSRIAITLGFSGIGTGAKAVSSIDPELTTNTSVMTLLEILQIGSYIVSILVGITVLWRFVIFLSDKSKLTKLRRKHKNARAKV